MFVSCVKWRHANTLSHSIGHFVKIFLMEYQEIISALDKREMIYFNRGPS